MKKIFLPIFFIIFAMMTAAQSKSSYDLKFPSFKKTASSQTAGLEYQSTQNSIFSATMITGGYYTLGTTSGISASKLDDNCSLTFGHPYALTSYPVFAIDGTWTKLDEYFSDPSNLKPVRKGDTLLVHAETEGKASVTFAITLNEAGNSLLISGAVKNLDSVPHKMGAGLVMDPALGKWGDAYFEAPVEQVFTGAGIPSELMLWEKGTGAKGLCMDASFGGNKPETIIAGNWAELHSSAGPDFNSAAAKNIYDLLFKLYWPEQELAPGDSAGYSVIVTLPQPDFSSNAFLRWDMPSYISIDNGLMFPQSLESYVEVNSAGNTTLSDLKLEFTFPPELSSSVSEINIPQLQSNPVYEKISAATHIVYEEKVVDATVKLMKGSTEIDEISRRVLIPQTPVSDTGLIVNIDTIITSGYPQVKFTFDTKVNSTGMRVTKLVRDNIFLYENSQRINDFSIGRDTSGGVTAADIIFVLDVTGSMSGSISSVKDNIIEFADSLNARGVDYRLGMVTFLDNVENTYQFTDDVILFKSYVSQQYAHGGGDGPENSLQALEDAAKFRFRSTAKKIIIWITDSNYHEKDWATALDKQTVLNEILLNEITVNAIGQQAYKWEYYDPFTEPTGGNFYDISGNFRDVLLDISRMNSSNKFMVTYNSPSGTTMNTVKLELRYAGLGGNTSFQYSTTSQKINEKRMIFYPNPFNPEITFKINKGNYSGGSLIIYNLLGQEVRRIFLSGDKVDNVVWNAKNGSGGSISAGFYIVRLMLNGIQGERYYETAKILYLK